MTHTSIALSSCALSGLALLALASPAAADGGVYQESGGIVVMEIESSPPVDDWVEEQTFSGYTFRGFYRWTGPNLFGTPGVAILSYRFAISTPGEYVFNLRNRHEDPDPTEANDVWARMDGGEWIKVFSNMSGSVGAWTWESRFDIPGQPQASYFLGGGEHLLELSARSAEFMMDRIHLVLPPNPLATDPTAPESVALLGSPFCDAVASSFGVPGQLDVTGSSFAAKQDVRLRAYRLPPNEFGYFLVSSSRGSGVIPPGSAGRICLTNPNIGRFVSQVQNSRNAGMFEIVVDTQNLPTPTPAAIGIGDTWSFQAWFRDGATSNFTVGIETTFQ